MSLSNITKGYICWHVKPGDLIRLTMNPLPSRFQNGLDWVFRYTIAHKAMYLKNYHTGKGAWLPEDAIGVFSNYGHQAIFLWEGAQYFIPNHLFEKV
jgi:hypothetical protein